MIMDRNSSAVQHVLNTGTLFDPSGPRGHGIPGPNLPGSTVPRRNSPLATGPSVFAVLEGRTPFQGIAREMKVPPHPAGIKFKWLPARGYDGPPRSSNSLVRRCGLSRSTALS